MALEHYLLVCVAIRQTNSTGVRRDIRERIEDMGQISGSDIRGFWRKDIRHEYNTKQYKAALTKVGTIDTPVLFEISRMIIAVQ